MRRWRVGNTHEFDQGAYRISVTGKYKMLKYKSETREYYLFIIIIIYYYLFTTFVKDGSISMYILFCFSGIEFIARSVHIIRRKYRSRYVLVTGQESKNEKRPLQNYARLSFDAATHKF